MIEQRSALPQRQPLPGTVQLLWAAMGFAFSLTILLGYLRYKAGLPAPHYNPLSGSDFDDLLEYGPTYGTLHTADFFHSPTGLPAVAYPPVTAALFAVLYAIGHPIAIYVATLVAWLSAALAATSHALLRRGISATAAVLFPLTMALLAFPLQGLVQRGNIELYLWILAACGTWAWLRQRSYAAAILWGLAAAMKLYPLLFLGLLLPQRRFKAFAAGLATFAGSSALSLWFLGPTMATAWHGEIRNVFGYQGRRTGEWSLHELAANHSLFNWVKFAARLFSHPLDGLTLPYLAGCTLILAVAFFGRLVRMPRANQLLALTVFMLMVPPVSYFYTLVHLFAPLLVLVMLAVDRQQRGQAAGKALGFTLLLFVPLLSSFMLFTSPQHFLFGGLVQSFVLMLLFWCALRFPFPDSFPFTEISPSPASVETPANSR